MGFFDFLKKIVKTGEIPQINPVVNSKGKEKTIIADGEKTMQRTVVFEDAIVSFEDRKKIAIPSKNGLFPAEILLLYYCSKGKYPETKNAYPKFWWYEYGIQDVDAVLKSLESRGFIAYASLFESVGYMNVTQLKELLLSQGQIGTGKKPELIARIANTVPEEILIKSGVKRKYILTEIGEEELQENAYVPYMHRVHNKTTENERFGMMFNVWSINKLLGTGDKSNWKKVVEEQESQMNKEIEDRHERYMKDLKKLDLKMYRELAEQEKQISIVQEARKKYDEDSDLDYYIGFWEKIWREGGLKFEGIGWHFELADLYIKEKRYEDAVAFVKEIKKRKPEYAYKSDNYLKMIENRIKKNSGKDL